MKRTKEWWAQLTEEERAELVRLERADALSSTAHLDPSGRSKCVNCSIFHLGRGLCPRCLARLTKLINKADAGIIAGCRQANENPRSLTNQSPLPEGYA